MHAKADDRLVVHLHERTSPRQRRELGAFVRYCVFRMERELGELRWLVAIAPAQGGFTCSVAVTFDNLLIESQGRGFDGVCAAWDALTRVARAVRESRGDRSRGETDHLAAWETS